VVPELVGEQRVASAVRTDELADSTHEEEPSERVARLAPGHQHPYPALGRPITAAITKLAAWCDSRLSGMAAAKDSSARTLRTILQILGDPRRTLMDRTLRGERSGNVTAGWVSRSCPAGLSGPRTAPPRPG
jgi:hypothetical protein